MNSLPSELAATLAGLERGPAMLRDALRSMPEARWRAAPPSGGFCLVEHAWHMADLEREGYGVRVRRLLEEEEPLLPDFDGDRVARERGYASRPLEGGIEVFAAARAANLVLLRSVGRTGWTRTGTQEGVGRITLLDIPQMMLRHDRSHAVEIEALLGDW